MVKLVLFIGAAILLHPGGPDVSTRPKPNQCLDWAKEAGFKILQQPLTLEPYHFGVIFQKP